MYTFIVTLLFVHAVAGSQDVQGKCLNGPRHKDEPGPEDDSYKACHVFKSSSCCTSEFTNQLAVPVVEKIGNFSWNLCGNLSKICQDFMVGVECFYSCSPYVGLWASGPASFSNAPVCSDYCNMWYDACKTEPTCAKNWITDFDYTASGANKCKRNCTTFEKLYSSGEELCNSMWGKSFNYTEDQDLCLHFRYNKQYNPNKDVVQKIFGEDGGVAIQCSIIGLVLAVLFNTVFSQY